MSAAGVGLMGALGACSGGGNGGGGSNAAVSADPNRVMPPKGGPARTPTEIPNLPEGFVGPPAYTPEPLVSGKDATLRIAVPQSISVGDWKTNQFTKWFQDRTGVTPQWQTIPDGDDAQTKINALIASNDLPEVIMGFWLDRPQVWSWAQQGIIVDMKPYLEDYGKNGREALGISEEWTAAFTAPDGGVYSYPNVNECYPCATQMNKMWVNQIYLDQVGMERPQSLDEFTEMLRAFKSQTPAKKPLHFQDGEWPDAWASQSFMYNPGRPWLTVDSGKVQAAFVQDGFRKTLVYLRSLVDEGLLDPATLGQSNDQLRRSVAAGKVGAAAVAWEGSLTNDLGQQRSWISLGPVAGPDGTRIAAWDYYVGLTFGQTVMTRACRSPELAVAWMDEFLELESTIRSYSGVKGKDWEWSAKDQYGTNGRQGLYTLKELSAPNGSAWGQANPSYRTSDVRDGMVNPKKNANPDELRALFDGNAAKYDPYKQPVEQQYPPTFIDATLSADIARAQVDLENEVNAAIDGFIRGRRDINGSSDWDDFVKKMDEMGLQNYLDMRQSVLDKRNG